MTEHWSLDKRVNISHILATVVMAVGLVMWGGRLETKVEIAQLLLEERAKQQAVIDAKQDQALINALLQLRTEMTEIKQAIRDLNQTQKSDHIPGVSNHEKSRIMSQNHSPFNGTMITSDSPLQ